MISYAIEIVWWEFKNISEGVPISDEFNIGFKYNSKHVQFCVETT